ncbi:MAG TPA: hypothetical protein VF145_09950, partial [Chitinophagaceae bacterium]
NRAVKNTKRGAVVYVLANGPSLNNYPKEKLFGKDVIVMNAFHLCTWKDKVNIVAHCFGEPSWSPAWEDPFSSFMRTNAGSYWMHLSSKGRIDPSRYAGKRFFYVCPAVPTRFWGSGKPDLALPVLGYMTTAQLAIMVAIYMGYSKIYLLGFDHDWLAQRKISPHFYEENDSVKPADLSAFSYYSLIKMVKEKWEIYYKLQNVAKRAGINIINLSRPTYLDVFAYGDNHDVEEIDQQGDAQTEPLAEQTDI